MSVLLGQLVYTSFLGVGLKLLTSAQVPKQIQQAFIEQVVYQLWDSYNPPKPGYRAAYLHQLTPEHTLFGWLYNDGQDEFGRSDVPYFVCYYCSRLLHTVQLENILTCLHRGPVALIDRHSLPVALETIVVPKLWIYQPARLGVAIPADVRQRSHIALEQGSLLNLFVSLEQREAVTRLNEQTNQQPAELSIYTSELAISSETDTAAANTGNAAIISEISQPEYADKKKLYSQFEQILIQLIGPVAPILLQQVAEQTANEQELIATLALHLNSEQKIKFEQRAAYLFQQSALEKSKPCVVDQVFIDKCEQELTKLIGPIAAFIVQEVLQSHPQVPPAEFVEKLSAEIPNRQKAEQFRHCLFP